MRFYVVPGAAPEVLEAGLRALAESGHEVVNDPRGLPPPGGLAQAERQAFLLAVDRMLEAEALLVEASEESAAAGWCAAWFLAKGRIVVLACRRDRRASLSPMLAGNPSPWQRLVTYEGPEDLRRSLVALLGKGGG